MYLKTKLLFVFMQSLMYFEIPIMILYIKYISCICVQFRFHLEKKSTNITDEGGSPAHERKKYGSEGRRRRGRGHGDVLDRRLVVLSRALR